MTVTGKERMFRALGAAVAIASLVLIAYSSTVPWARLEAKTKLGIIPVSMDADLYEYGIDYNASINSSQFLPGAKMPSNLADRKVFLTGLGDFQTTIGFIKGTTKEKNWTFETKTWPPPEYGIAECNVTTFVRTIPWWPVGLAQEAGITIEMTCSTSVSEISVQRVWFEVHRAVGGKDQYKIVAESSPGDSIKKVGERRTYTAGITIDEDFGEFTLVGRVRLELKDTYGHSNNGAENLSLSEPREIKLWTMGADKTARLGMMVAAYPLSIASVVLLAFGAALGLLGGTRKRAARWAWRLLLAGGVLALLAVLFYVLGVGALIELTGYGKWFTWKSHFYIAVAGACLSMAPGILLFMVRPPPPAPGERLGPGTDKDKRPGRAPPAKPAEPKREPAEKAAQNAPPPTNKVIK